MRNRIIAAIAAACLILAGCGDSGGTAPRRFSTLQGSWVGTHGDLTIQLDLGADTLCAPTYGYCGVSGTGTYAYAGGDSGSFAVYGDYFIDGKLITLNLGFGSDANCLFGGKFDSQTEIFGTLSETDPISSPLHAGVDGFPLTLTRQ